MVDEEFAEIVQVPIPLLAFISVVGEVELLNVHVSPALRVQVTLLSGGKLEYEYEAVEPKPSELGPLTANDFQSALASVMVNEADATL